jgi:hypothetical protein
MGSPRGSPKGWGMRSPKDWGKHWGRGSPRDYLWNRLDG